jgi:hypothetical protein
MAQGEDSTAIRFVAAKVTSATARTDLYKLQVNWQRGSETATCTVQVEVQVAP